MSSSSTAGSSRIATVTSSGTTVVSVPAKTNAAAEGSCEKFRSTRRSRPRCRSGTSTPPMMVSGVSGIPGPSSGDVREGTDCQHRVGLRRDQSLCQLVRVLAGHHVGGDELAASSARHSVRPPVVLTPTSSTSGCAAAHSRATASSGLSPTSVSIQRRTPTREVWSRARRRAPDARTRSRSVATSRSTRADFRAACRRAHRRTRP